MATQFEDGELRELYEVLNGCQAVLKWQEQAQAGREFLTKPTEYSPLVRRLIAVRNEVGEKIARLPQQG